MSILAFIGLSVLLAAYGMACFVYGMRFGAHCEREEMDEPHPRARK